MNKKYYNKLGVSVSVVLFVIIVLGLIIDSVIELNLNAHRRELEEYVWLDAKNAASSAIEYGFAQLKAKFGSNKSLAYNTLAPQNSPLTLPSEFFTTFGNTASPWNTSKIVLPNQATYSPSNTSQWNTRPTDLVGGTIPNSSITFINGNNPGEEYDPLKNQYITTRVVTVYGKATAQNFQGHTSTVYAMEQLQVRDSPLFANAIFYNMNMEIAPGANMTVTGPVHTNYNAYVDSSTSLNFNGPVTAAGSLIYGVPYPSTGGGGSISFANTAGTLVSMYQNGTWIQSSLSNFYQEASQLWGGNVQTSVFSVPLEQPVGVPNYAPTSPPSNSDLNYAYQLIDPVLNTGAPTYNTAVEQEKYAYQAGLTIVVNPGANNTVTPTVTLQTYARNADGTIQYNASGNPVTTTLTYSGASFITPQAYTTQTTGSGQNKTTKVTGGIYDQRQATGYSLVQIDMGKLANALNSASNWGASGGSVGAAPSNWWNGIIYVQNGNSMNNGSSDGIVTQHTGANSDDVGIPNGYCAVQLTDGSTIPNPSFASSPGTTLATDAPLYVVGNYNSTGNNNITSEPPASLAADAITVLSNNWSNANSDMSLSSRVANNTEVNSAFLAGIVPSNMSNNGTYSGGVENFPRFLENWNNQTFSYQGSIVALYESEIAKAPWPGTGSVYNPPTRNWSFSSTFAGGTYPPGAPNSRTYKRMNYTEMSAAQWNAAMNTLKSDTNYW